MTGMAMGQPQDAAAAEIIETERLALRPLQLADAAWVGRESGRWEVASQARLRAEPESAAHGGELHPDRPRQ